MPTRRIHWTDSRGRRLAQRIEFGSEGAVIAQGAVEVISDRAKMRTRSNPKQVGGMALVCTDDGVVVTGAAPKGVGTIFEGLLTETYALKKSCTKCDQVVKRMNRIGPCGCRARKAEIIEGMWERRDKLRGWKGFGLRLVEAGAKAAGARLDDLPAVKPVALRQLGALFDQAVAECSSHSGSCCTILESAPAPPAS